MYRDGLFEELVHNFAFITVLHVERIYFCYRGHRVKISLFLKENCLTGRNVKAEAALRFDVSISEAIQCYLYMKLLCAFIFCSFKNIFLTKKRKDNIYKKPTK